LMRWLADVQRYAGCDKEMGLSRYRGHTVSDMPR
jgi:hypothetical protein